jgi:hypothetical protein
MQQSIVSVFMIDGEQPPGRVLRSQRQGEELEAIVMHASLLGLFRGRVTGIRLERWPSGDRIAPGIEHFGSIAGWHDDCILFRHRHTRKAEERASCFGALSSPAHQWAMEHGHTSRNQPSLEEAAARQVLDQYLRETGI